MKSTAKRCPRVDDERETRRARNYLISCKFSINKSNACVCAGLYVDGTVSNKDIEMVEESKDFIVEIIRACMNIIVTLT